MSSHACGALERHELRAIFVPRNVRGFVNKRLEEGAQEITSDQGEPAREMLSGSNPMIFL
jgi:hypothetical protein